MVKTGERGYLKMESMLKDKRGLSLVGTVTALVLLGVVLVVGFLILGGVMDSSSVTGDAQDAVNETIQALAEIPGWLPVIVIVIIAGILLFIALNVLPKGGSSAI